MNPAPHLANHLRHVHFGGNWTVADLKTHLADVSLLEASTSVYNLNTIATLVFHMNYYVEILIRVLQHKPLEGKDELSFNVPPLHSETDWENLKSKSFADAETLAGLIEQLPESIWEETFFSKKYGNYFRNFCGVIEHTHYHLGQIVLIKKIIRSQSSGSTYSHD